jgi:hypothetical protein
MSGWIEAQRFLRVPLSAKRAGVTIVRRLFDVLRRIRAQAAVEALKAPTFEYVARHS